MYWPTGYLLRNLIGKFFSPQRALTRYRQIHFADLLRQLLYLLRLPDGAHGMGQGIYLSGAISFSFFLYLTIFFYFYNEK